MKIMLPICFLLLFTFSIHAHSQIKILFDATKAEMAGNADWIIDADSYNLGYTASGSMQTGLGDNSNPQQTPTPTQSNVTASTLETYWSGAISSWAIDCAKQGYTISTLPYNGQISYGNINNPQDLSNYNAFIVCEPNIVFSSAEKTAILNYIKNGGSLFMVSDHDVSDRNGDGWDSPHIWNDLMSNNTVQKNPFGMVFDYNDYSETSTNIPNLPADSILHGPFGSVTQVKFTGGTSLTLSPASNPSVKGIVYASGSNFGNNNVYFAYSYYGIGKVVALTDSSPCDDGTGDPNDNLFNGYLQDANGNHRRLLMNATIWLVSHPGTLPIHFVNFTGTTSLHQNTLYWSADETNANNSYYEIERSQNGILFSSIGSLPSHTNAAGITQYSWIDHSPLNAINFYRIKSYGKDNTSGYSPVISLINDENTTLKALPNPVKNNMDVYFDPVMANSTIKLYAANGTLVYTHGLLPAQQYQHIDMSKFTAGIYIIAIETGGKVKQQKKIQKQ